MKLLRMDPKQVRLPPFSHPQTLPIPLPNGTTVQLPPLPHAFSSFPLIHDECMVIPSSSSATRHTAKREVKRRGSFKQEEQITFHGFDPAEFSAMYEEYKPWVDEGVVSWFRAQNWCAETVFRPATMRDIPMLCQVNRVNPLYFKKEVFESVLKTKNEFVIVAEKTNPRGKRVLVGMIHYYLIWYCASNSPARKRGGLLNAEDLIHIPPQRVVYVCTLQTVKRQTHPEYVEKWGMEGDEGCGKCLFSLACEHGKKKQMRFVLLDSTDDAIGFYERVFGMRKNERAEGREYTPMQLELKHWSYRMCFNYALRRPSSLG